MFLTILLNLLPALLSLLVALLNRKATITDYQKNQIARARGMWQAADAYCEQAGIDPIRYQPASRLAGHVTDREGFRAELVGLLEKAAKAPSMFVSATDKEVIAVAIPVIQKDNDDVNACLDMMLATLPAQMSLKDLIADLEE